jgi:membrane protein DedA with SNARE-associated domain
MPGLLLIALATLVSEDLTCIATGVLVAQGRLSFFWGTLACVVGIFTGDLLLFMLGRVAGRAAFRWAAIRRCVTPAKVDRASAWLSEKGLTVILLSRFTPGLRLTTYFAAGLLKTRFWQFASLFLFASTIWTPLLVGSTAILGEQTLRAAFARRGDAVALFVMVFVLFMAGRKVADLALRDRSRRRFIGFLKRKFRWEFWPAWAAYLPVVPYLLYLGIKYRSLTVFTAANPGMPSGGFVGESKSQILDHLRRNDKTVADYAVIPAELQFYARVLRVREFMDQRCLSFPIVLKPDVGERGSGVAIIRSQVELEDYLRSTDRDSIVQQHVAGCEYGVFYYRYPNESKGRIYAITEKRFPEVIGDGKRRLAELILRDPRAVCLTEIYLIRSRRPVDDIPAPGEAVQLVEVGSHCRGSVFLDGSWLKTEALEDAIDLISHRHPGFFFGRYDIRAVSLQAFREGRGFQVIELNGVSAEATHIYDPAVTLLGAYRSLFRQWRIAFEIGGMNRDRGVQPMPVKALWKLISRRLHGKSPAAPSRAYRPAEQAS